MSKDARKVLIIVAALLMTGIVMIYSSSAVYAYDNYGDSMYFVKRHLVYLAGGVAACVIMMMTQRKWLEDNARWILCLAVLLLVAVLVPGIGVAGGGAKRWLRIAGLSIQPSEFAKFAIIIYLADLMSRKRYLMKDLMYGFFPPLIVSGFVAGMILIEPDMGTAVSVLFVSGVLLFISGARMTHIGALIMCMLPALYAAVRLKAYRVRRIMAFLDPFQYKEGAGYQLYQSFIAIGSGGFLGVGLGQSKQKLFYLPQSHTDFIFAIIGEELGVVGALSVLLLFALLVLYMFRIALRINDVFSSRVVLGIALMIAFETIVNIGVSTGMLPTKGLPLPFISYGGSSLVCHMAVMGIIFNLSREAE
ncbi:MAG: putative lipid II flippase FtsW [Candidatus Omnitrophica bacterium]|nr:putative lipid II flippase FtsW [Candidatus Omnitrophota bacterium]MDD5488020.1 putative lipid II flippase FtsW [Candidatus Omnitrophota bacterium]